MTSAGWHVRETSRGGAFGRRPGWVGRLASRPWRGHGAAAASLLPFLGLQAMLFWIPLALFFAFALGDGARHWADLLESSAKLEAVGRTVWIGSETTVLCALLAYLYVGALLGAGRIGRIVLLTAVFVPFLTSIVVRTYAWIIVLGNAGPVNAALRWLFGPDAGMELIYNRAGVLIGMVHVLLPMFVLPLYAVMSQIPPNLGRAARTLGASRVDVFLSVTLPLSLPGAATGAVLVFVQALGFYVTPTMLGGLGDVMVAQFIDSEMTRYANVGAAAVLSIVLVCGVGLCIGLFRLFYPIEMLFVQGGSLGAGARGGRPPEGRRRVPEAAEIRLARGRRMAVRLLDWLPWSWGVRIGALLIAFYLVAPLAVVLPVSLIGESYLHFPPTTYSLRWYEAVLADPEWRLAATNSLTVALIAVAGAVAVGLPLAFTLVRSRLPDAVKGGLMGVLVLPAIVPVIVLAVGIYVWYLELHLIADRVALGMAHAMLGLPFVTLVLVSTLRDFDIRVERAARSLGAGPVRTFLLVTLPLLAGALVTGAVLTFLHSIDELLVARAVTNYDTITLPVKLWNGANEEISPALAVVSTVSMALAVTVALGLMTRGRRRARPAGRGG